MGTNLARVERGGAELKGISVGAVGIDCAVDKCELHKAGDRKGMGAGRNKILRR